MFTSTSASDAMFRELLAKEFAPFGALTGEQLEDLEAHYRLLSHWNVRLNLTRVASLDEAVRLHYCESLFLATKLPPGELTIADIGSGSGFPGIPIAILRPECEVTLVESHKRKGVFLREATRQLKNILVVTDRAENLFGHYDWLVSRAVAMDDLLKLRLSNNLAVLGGIAGLSSSNSNVLIPWGNRRYLMFHVKHA